MTDDINPMLERDDEEWQGLTRLLDGAGEVILHEPGAPPWNARDVYAHLARWINHSTDALEALRDGREPPAGPPGTDDEINARWQAEDQALSFQDARDRAHRAYQRRLDAIASIDHGRWDNPMRVAAQADGYEHYASHRRYIETAGREGG